MAIPRFISDLAGTARSAFQIGLTSAGAVLKAVSGGFVVRDTADSTDAPLTASELRSSGDTLKLNSDAAGSGSDFEYVLERPTTGMTASVTLKLPPNDGSPNQVFTTDGSGNASWETPASGAPNGDLLEETTLNFGDSSPAAMFTKPANSKITLIRITIRTPFNGTAPTVSIGIAGNTSKYGATTQVDLKAPANTVFEFDPGEAATVGAESLIATYNADSSSAGQAVIGTFYGVPA